jgi:hypothetical protein
VGASLLSVLLAKRERFYLFRRKKETMAGLP